MDNDSTPENLPGPWPWYVLLLVGHAVSGFFSWLMLAWALYQRDKKHTALIIFALNLMIFGVSGWLLLSLKMSWWRLMVLVYVFNLMWSLSAVIFQKNAFSYIEERYRLNEWKSWLKTILIGALIGGCLATIFSVVPAFQNRVEMRQTLDCLDRQTVLWGFFRYSPIGVLGGFFLGLWWAGEKRRFHSSHLITFLSAFFLMLVTWGLLSSLLLFLVQKGAGNESQAFSSAKWAMIPPWVGGFHKFLLQLKTYDISPLIVVPLLLGAVSRIRDFAKRALLIPLTFIIALPLGFSTVEWWQNRQNQIIYEMDAADARTKASAHRWADILLVRYPNHLQWPGIGEDLARYYYQKGEFEKARSVYKVIHARYNHSNQWYWSVKRARGALDNPDFGNSPSGPYIDIPTVDYEEYLTHNWIALLSVVRFWKGPKISESDVLIELKELSKSDEKIELSPLTSLADLDDAARNLGYEVLIMPANLMKAKSLIAAGLPVVHEFYNAFHVIQGFDESRSVVYGLSFKKLSARLRQEKRDEAKEILSIEAEGLGESRKRLTRIANEAYVEYPVDYWKSPAVRFTGPLMAIVFPSEKTEVIENALDTHYEKLKKESNGYLASLIGLAYLNHADPVYAVEWSRIAAQKIAHPLPLYVAHLAEMWWTSRSKIVKSTLRLQDQFPELAQIFDYFNHPETQEFLRSAQIRFNEDLNNNGLPWMISQKYLQMLDRSNKAELEKILEVMEKRVSLNPSSYQDWRFLADAYEWADDMDGVVRALAGAVSANPIDSSTKLRLAFAYVSLEQFAKAEGILEQIDPKTVKYDADYPFCIGAVAEWKRDVNTALKKYEEAIRMRRYKPLYHLRYGRLLLKENKTAEARKCLQWAMKIDATEAIKEEAARLLSSLGS